MKTRRAMHRAIASAAALLGALAFLSACSSLGSVDTLNLLNIAAKSSEAVAKSFEDITPEQEYYVGRAVGANILAQYPPFSEAKANTYLNLLGQSLALASDRPETFGGYHFLILDSDEINAFAAPGGLIFVSRGLLRCADSEDAVAAILAHEIGHVARQHGLKAIKTARFKDAGLAIGMAAVEELGPSELAKVTAAFSGTIDDITSTLVNSGYSRGAEKEADLAAVDILKRAGYDPNALVRMLKVMDSRLKPGAPDFAKTHPDPEDRIASIRRPVAGLRPDPAGGAAGPAEPLPGGAGQDLRRMAGSPRARKALQGVLVGLASGALALGLAIPGLLDTFEGRTWDWRVRLLARPGAATEQIALILLDQDSLDWGKEVNGLSWPWPRETYAVVADFCRRGGAKALAFDVLYTEPSVYGVYDDEAFAAAVAENGRVVGAVFLSPTQGTAESWPEAAPQAPICRSRSGGLARGLGPPAGGAGVPPGHLPHPGAGRKRARAGQHQPEPGQGGRGVPPRPALFNLFDGRVVPSLALGAYLAGEPRDPTGCEVRPGRLTRRRPERAHRRQGPGRAALPRSHPDPPGLQRRRGAAERAGAARRRDAQARPGGCSRDRYVFFGFTAPGPLRPAPLAGAGHLPRRGDPRHHAGQPALRGLHAPAAVGRGRGAGPAAGRRARAWPPPSPPAPAAAPWSTRSSCPWRRP